MMDPKGDQTDEETLLTELERIKRSDDIQYRYGAIIAMKSFGASAPLKELQKKFGFTVENVVEKAKEQAAKNK